MFTSGCRRALRRLRAPDEDGFSLIEVIIAIFVVSVGMLALASTALTAIQSTRISRERQDATQLASRIIEDTRSHDFSDIALDSGTYGGSSTYGAENVIQAVGGTVPHEVSQPPLVANTWVTWTDATETEKRVTTVVSWVDRGADRQVRQSTLISEARRGLPVPNFQITPDESSKNAVPGEVVCFDHDLTNLGERDSYSWQLLRPDPGDPTSLTAANPQTRTVEEDGSNVTRQGYDIPDNSGPGKGWFAWARIGPTVSTLAPMVDATSDGRPDSPSPVDRRGEAIVRVCYTPKNASGSVRANHDAAPYLTVRMFSAFDENVNRDVDDSLTVISNDYVLNLHSEYRGGSGNPETASSHGYNLLMDRAGPINASSAIDYDGGGVEGLQLPVSSAARFRYQNSGATREVLAGDARLRLSVATASSLAGTPAGDLTITATVVHETDPSSPPTVLGTRDFTITPNASAWTLLDESLTTIPIASAVLLDTHYLRLDIGCTTTAGEACHIHYDVVTTHASSLTVTVQ